MDYLLSCYSWYQVVCVACACHSVHTQEALESNGFKNVLLHGQFCVGATSIDCGNKKKNKGKPTLVCTQCKTERKKTWYEAHPIGKLNVQPLNTHARSLCQLDIFHHRSGLLRACVVGTWECRLALYAPVWTFKLTCSLFNSKEESSRVGFSFSLQCQVIENMNLVSIRLQYRHLFYYTV